MATNSHNHPALPLSNSAPAHCNETFSQRRGPLHLLDWKSLACEAEYKLERVSAISGYSVRTLQRHIADQFKTTLHAFIADFRMERARAILEAGASVKEAAFQLGFKTTSHFIRSYREKFGITPGIFVARMRDQRAPDQKQRAA